MGRRTAEGWRIRWDGPGDCTATVRFRHKGKRVELGLGRFDLAGGGRDDRAAEEAAALRYAEVVSGRLRPGSSGLSAPGNLETSIGKWTAAMVGSYSKETVSTLVTYGRHWLSFFGDWARVHDAGIADYGRARLRRTLRKTVSKELWGLRTFLGWCVERGWLEELPTFAPLPKRSTGVRTGKQRAHAVAVSLEDIERFLDALPEWSDKAPKFPVRAFFEVSAETGLRPATIRALRVPEHYARGRATLTITDAIDKVRFGRELPLTPRARAALDRVCPDVGVVFGNHNWSKQVAKARVVADMPKGFAPYDLRHGRATHLLEASGDILGVGYLLGHKHATTTNKYLHHQQHQAARTLAAMGERPGVGPRYMAPEQPAAAVTVTIGGASGGSDEETLEKRGDRRGSNPRRLEPQSTARDGEDAKSSANSDGAVGEEGAEGPPKAARGATSGGSPPIRKAAQGLAFLRATEHELDLLWAEELGIAVPRAGGAR